MRKQSHIGVWEKQILKVKILRTKEVPLRRIKTKHLDKERSFLFQNEFEISFSRIYFGRMTELY